MRNMKFFSKGFYHLIYKFGAVIRQYELWRASP